MADKQIWSLAKPASFEIDGFDPVLFPAIDNEDMEEGLRVAARQVPFIDGEELDETGLTSKTFTVTAIFSMEITEPGLGDDPPLYPTRIEKLLDLFRQKKTGTLHLPWCRNIRCKAVSWRRTEKTPEMKDTAILAITFKTDNENKLDQQKTQALPASTVVQLAIKAEFEAEKAGAWDGSWEDLTRFTAQLEAVMNAPGEYRQDVASKAKRVSSCCDRILKTHSKSDVGRSGLLDPAATPAIRLLNLIKFQADSAEAEARAGDYQVLTRTAERATSIWEFAISAGADPYVVIQLNPQIEDLSYVPAGTQITMPRS